MEPHHYLQIERLEDGTLEWEVEHDPGCPQEPWTNDLDGQTVYHHTCSVGVEVMHAGLEGLADWDKLAPGRYEISFWATKTPAGPWGGEEWDSGLEIVAGPLAVPSPA